MGRHKVRLPNLYSYLPRGLSSSLFEHLDFSLAEVY